VSAALATARLLKTARLRMKQRSIRMAGMPDLPAECDQFLRERLQVAVECALAAGDAISAAIKKKKQIINKGVNDLVTETDKANEKMIFQRLRTAFPDDCFIGEESSSEAGCTAALTDAPTWLVDPVADGTTNFVHSFPLTCVSIGFASGGKMKLGVVFDPCARELFVACAGFGAYVNGERVAASSCTSLAHALVVQEYGYERDPESIRRMLGATSAVLAKVRGLRQVGSGAIDLCWVGCGRTDAVFSGLAGEGWQPWDYAAGWVFAAEGGATMLQLNGAPFHSHAKSVLCAATPELAAEISSTCQPFMTLSS
ncbi:unnamed protein product, partial [Phaeothamnion confervicola]